MEKDIIEKYQDYDYSLEKLSKEFKMGKLKIKKILYENNIPIKKKGGQTKLKNFIDFNVDIDNKIIQCKKCNKIFNDIENKSGIAIEHIQKCFDDVNIPSKRERTKYKNENGTYWHFKYFNLIPKNKKEKLCCSECNWFTYDLSNKSGSLTKHIQKKHGLLSDFLDRNNSYIKYFNTFFKLDERLNLLSENNNSIKCKICGKKLKIISNSHIKTHNITSEEYKTKYGYDNFISKNTLNTFKENLLNSTYEPKYRSRDEIEIENFLRSQNIIVDAPNKTILNGSELDILLPEYKIAIEYNGLYWHSEKQGKTKDYHIDKTKKCLDKGIRLIHIFEDEWNNKKDIIKNRLLNLINKNNNKIFARNCDVIEISKEEKKDYLERNHLQGNDKSKIFIGLKYNNNIVGVITFGNLRKSMGNKSFNPDVFELYRFSSDNVIGGFSKMLSYFIKNYNPQKIITYSDRNWSPSIDFCFYGKVGFKFVLYTKPNYYYLKKYIKREHRFNYRKDVLVKLGYDKNKSEFEIMKEMGFDKIWDTGNIKYEIDLNTI